MQITLEIPDDSLSITRESPDEFARSLRIAAAVKWYELGRISQSKAAELIGCNRVELFNHLRDYNVSYIQVGAAELEEEVADSESRIGRCQPFSGDHQACPRAGR